MNYTDNGRQLNDREYKIYLEGMAYGIWRSRISIGLDDGYQKTCDPLMFNLEDEKDDEVYSYVFDLWDGGRHHKFKDLEQVKDCLLDELPTTKSINKIIK